MLAVIAAVGIAGASALRARAAAGRAAPSPELGDVSASSPRDTNATSSIVSVPSPVVTAPASPALATKPTAIAPLVPVGRTALRDTMVAERAGDTVRVTFDLAFSRTRRPDKFEAIVRSTLPQVYGPPADSALRALPEGAVARAGDLVTTLPERGFRIPLADGRTIAVWPETRAGRDGPLVVAYRAVGSR